MNCKEQESIDIDTGHASLARSTSSAVLVHSKQTLTVSCSASHLLSACKVAVSGAPVGVAMPARSDGHTPVCPRLTAANIYETDSYCCWHAVICLRTCGAWWRYASADQDGPHSVGGVAIEVACVECML